MLGMTVSITGRNPAEIEAALDTVMRSVENGLTEGSGREGHANFQFLVAGHEEAEPEPPCFIDYGKRIDTWEAMCAEHGLLADDIGSREGHDRMVQVAVRHDQDEHGGDGIIPFGALFAHEEVRQG